MFSITRIFSRYRRRVERVLVIDRVIRSLRISDEQKDLYVESLKMLDDDRLDAFYGRLFEFFEVIEEKDSSELAEARQNAIMAAFANETNDRNAEKTKDFDEF